MQSQAAFDAKDLTALHSSPAFSVSSCRLYELHEQCVWEAGMGFGSFGRPPIERHRQSLSPPWCLVSQPLYTTCGMCLPVGVNVWHASVNTVHKLRTPRSLAPAGTDEAPGKTVSLCGAVAVLCAVLQLLPLHAGVGREKAYCLVPPHVTLVFFR